MQIEYKPKPDADAQIARRPFVIRIGSGAFRFTAEQAYRLNAELGVAIAAHTDATGYGGPVHEPRPDAVDYPVRLVSADRPE